MSQFPAAFQYLLGFEDPSLSFEEATDNNGAKVIAGINAAFFPEIEASIAVLPQTQRSSAVYQFYYSKFWSPMQAGGIESQDVANRYLDGGVNMGVKTIIKILQEAVNALHAGSVEEDGAIGPVTIAAINAADPDAILAAFRQQRAAHYQRIVAANPADKPYLNGWLRRAEA